jgi:hypothetical protein
MSLTNLFETRVLSWLFTGAAVTRPAEWHLGLSSTAPNEDGSNVTPPADPAYTRVAATFAVTGNEAANDTVLEFPESTVDQGTLTHGVVYDAPTGGNVLSYGPLRDNEGAENPIDVGAGQIVRIPIGAFRVTAD